MKKPVYLDYNATTPLHPEVIAGMKPFLDEYFGNPSSIYAYGSYTRSAVENARKNVASIIGCKAHEIIFTSGGTESNNIAIKGIVLRRRDRGNHIITCSIEHPAVLEVCRWLENQGFRVTYLPVDEFGMVSPEDLEKAITGSTILVTIMHSNNEVGTIQPVSELARIARNNGIVFHTDASQSVGKIPVDIADIDLLTIAGHKLYAPKGIGALYIREGIVLEKLIHGADQEQNIRPGTENVASIVGLGIACEVAQRDLGQNIKSMQSLRDHLHRKITESIPDIRLNGHPVQRLPNTLSLSFFNLEANLLLSEISEQVAASAGAACHAGDETISHVLKAMNVPLDYAQGTIRFSTGRFLTMEEIDYAANAIIEVMKRLQSGKNRVSFQGPIRLTSLTQGLGCACKLPPQVLEKVMKTMPAVFNPDVLVGYETSDDASVYKINDEQAIVQTLDFLTPIVDDPYDFGMVAAANALSDIYAMGVRPLFALNIVCFPSSRLPAEILENILRGAGDKAAQAGIQVIGGHSVDDPEPKFGMAVTGIIHPDKIITNNKARAGDLLILTKRIGTGVLSAALKRGLLSEEPYRALMKSMTTLNMSAAQIMENYPVNACTDISGFGLLGHLHEMTSGSKVNAEIYTSQVPFLPSAEELAAANIIPGGSVGNLDFVEPFVTWDEDISHLRKVLLCDAQTSGGLLISLPEKHAGKLVQELNSSDVPATVIGRIKAEGTGRIFVLK